MFQINKFIWLQSRDVSKYMKERNVIGSSKGYVQRVLDSYEEVTPERVRKYTCTSIKFAELYLDGETGYTIQRRMAELRKSHRGAASLPSDYKKKDYLRKGRV